MVNLRRTLSRFFDWVFAADHHRDSPAALRIRIQQQQHTIWALQHKLNTTTRENRLLRAQLEDLQELIAVAPALQHSTLTTAN